MPSCSYCNFNSSNSEEYLKHVVRFHQHEPNFLLYCSLPGCGRSFTKINSLQKHFSREHIQEEPENENPGETEGNDDGDDIVLPDFDNENAKQEMQAYAARFLLGIKEGARVSQSALQSIKLSTSSLAGQYLDIVKNALLAKIKERDQDFSFTPEMNTLFSAENMFEGLETEYQERAFYKEHFDLVEPVEVQLGKSWKNVTYKRRKILKHLPDMGYYVPFLENLQVLLQNPDVLQEVNNPHNSEDDVLRDVMDGSFFNSHPIFSANYKALQIIGYYDDLEVVNPLGSKTKKHKIGIYYYMLGNIHPRYRSTLRSIQLVAVAKTQYIRRHGVASLLKYWIHDLCELAKDEGHEFMIGESVQVYRGSLLLMSGDTLGSNFLGSFKEGVGGALRVCRHCMGTHDEIKCKHENCGVSGDLHSWGCETCGRALLSKVGYVNQSKSYASSQAHFFAEEFRKRDIASHIKHCQDIKDPQNSKQVRTHLSMTYGVNGMSVFHQVPHFDVCQCFPEDIMHILFEGCIPYETKRLLKVLIDEVRCITLSEVNARIENFDYGFSEVKNKPNIITRENLNSDDCKLRQSATQMLCLFHFIPVMIGDKVPYGNENWQCYLRLWNITAVVTAPEIPRDDVWYLRVLINEHHEAFKHLYPDSSVIPKIHYTIHLPVQILQFGPPRHIWCMRFEAKHSYFKSIVMKNFTNIPKSLSFRHQRYMCWQLLHSPGEVARFLYQGDHVGRGEFGINLRDHPLAQDIAKEAGLQEIPDVFIGGSVRSVQIHGIEYRPTFIVRIKEIDSANDFPVYGSIQEIIVWEDEKFFSLALLRTKSFHEHFMAYEVEVTEEKLLISYHNLSRHGCLHMIKKTGRDYIVEKDTAKIEID